MAATIISMCQSAGYCDIAGRLHPSFRRIMHRVASWISSAVMDVDPAANKRGSHSSINSTQATVALGFLSAEETRDVALDELSVETRLVDTISGCRRWMCVARFLPLTTSAQWRHTWAVAGIVSHFLQSPSTRHCNDLTTKLRCQINYFVSRKKNSHTKTSRMFTFYGAIIYYSNIHVHTNDIIWKDEKRKWTRLWIVDNPMEHQNYFPTRSHVSTILP